MAPTNKYTVWVNETDGIFVSADNIIVQDENVIFLRDGKIVYSLAFSEYVKYNGEPQRLENIE